MDYIKYVVFVQLNSGDCGYYSSMGNGMIYLADEPEDGKRFPTENSANYMASQLYGSGNVYNAYVEELL